MRPIESQWMDAVDTVAREVLRQDRTGDALAEAVAELSRVYTRDRRRLRDQEAALAARLRFFLPRDLPKVEYPLSELHRVGALPSRRTWRVLDLGAGLGTTHLGVARFAARTGAADGLSVRAIERSARSLRIAEALAPHAGLPVELDTRTGDMTRPILGEWDLIVVGLSLNELWGGAPDRVERRAAWIAGLLKRLAPDGSLIVVEPALREVTRDLQAVRDRLAEHVFAPCTQCGPCPMLPRAKDWCHQWLAVDLPESLRPVAKAAGLRWRGLSFAYLTLRRDGRRLSEALRVVDGPRPSKGVTTWTLCGAPGLVELRHLDRHARPGDVLDGAVRGTLLTVEPTPAPGGRLRSDRVSLVSATEEAGAEQEVEQLEE